MGIYNYPDTVEKAVRLLKNYQAPKIVYQKVQLSPSELAFLQKARAAADKATKGDEGGDGGATKTNSKGETHCFSCGEDGHWANECPNIPKEQRKQLHMKFYSLGFAIFPILTRLFSLLQGSNIRLRRIQFSVVTRGRASLPFSKTNRTTKLKRMGSYDCDVLRVGVIEICTSRLMLLIVWHF